MFLQLKLCLHQHLVDLWQIEVHDQCKFQIKIFGFWLKKRIYNNPIFCSTDTKFYAYYEEEFIIIKQVLYELYLLLGYALDLVKDIYKYRNYPHKCVFVIFDLQANFELGYRGLHNFDKIISTIMENLSNLFDTLNSNTDNLYVQLSTGVVTRRNACYVVLEEKINQAIVDYNTEENSCKTNNFFIKKLYNQ
ncbi:hypothetical protein BpHYR1_024508 [Brachionus plicatilis]|uniref:Uncharacterized protein n=1 Tax=Brachionus plicatilis TaxID=10195 RepID=A0A3M7QJZ6_BRAPC|nr:hypothetical protein BpHYR1_024508 [Brachionus plicatilis]